ncbi:CCE_0567 family metalloprotein [Cohaesibacter intestini]|uniref:CCE_0567 family metalloprotein n=1 Tax=Cohaesibacter intestini TaxID=2211145 RepID=UPI000DE8134D|nr:CCE_0567 family metalloprotein [Cohaesibacter intestini]
MDEADRKALIKLVRKAKRVASEKAMELHDLVEDRLPAAFEELPALAEETYQACKLWSEAEAVLQQAETKMEGA